MRRRRLLITRYLWEIWKTPRERSWMLMTSSWKKKIQKPEILSNLYLRNNKMNFFFTIRSGLILGIVALVTSCSSESIEKRIISTSVPVTVSIAAQKDIPVQIHTIGNVEAYSTVSVKTRVEGELSRVYFKEGQEVKK